MLTHNEFYSKKGESNRPYSLRLANLLETFKNNNSSCLSILKQDKISGDSHFQEFVQESTRNGWEGLMLRADESYKGKRSKDLLKYKSFHDDEYVVIAIKFGPFRYVKNGQECEEEMLSNVTVQHKGYNVDVGSGFTISERQYFYSNPDAIVGKVITVQYFEETNNQDGGISLRFPTLKYIHGVKRDV
jgi:DNA ligase-1